MNRAQRRAARRGHGDGSRLFFHGTTGVLADAIRTEGLRPGRDGRIYLTRSLGMAQRYAMWSTAMAATVEEGRDAWRPQSDIGRKAAELGEHVAVVVHVRVPAAVTVRPEHGSSAPPLPWETAMMDLGDAYYVDCALPTVGPFELWPVDELDESGMIDRVRRATTFPRSLHSTVRWLDMWCRIRHHAFRDLEIEPSPSAGTSRAVGRESRRTRGVPQSAHRDAAGRGDRLQARAVTRRPGAALTARAVTHTRGSTSA